jgi:ribosomal subunit interface protein
MAGNTTGQRDSANPEVRTRMRETIVSEAGNDAYRLTAHLAEPSTCGTCGVLYRAGRWQWPGEGVKQPPGAVITCPACRRIADNLPAGVLTLSGKFLASHREDVLAALRAEERLESAEHPLHRVMTTEESRGEMVITTTDVHLPRRIADAIANAYGGAVEMQYGPEDETVRVSWRREEGPAAGEAAALEPLALKVQTNGVIVTPEADAYLRERIEQLRHFYKRIASVRVVLDAPEGHHRTGGPYQVDVHAEVPGRDIHVTRQRSSNLHVAIAAAFDAAQRQLEDHARIQRGDVSPTVTPPRGRVVRLFPKEGYGFIAAADGHELYFHRNSVLEGLFDRLTVGTEVRFAEELGERGPQASTVALPDRG